MTLSFFSGRKNRDRKAPDVEPARVGVNVMAAARESARDMFNEARIRVLGNAWLSAATADDRPAERMYWDAYCAANAKRSPAQVARIETARGLR